MSDDTRANREFSTYTLAINDMEHVAVVARLIVDHDPLFNPLGPTVALPNGLHPKKMTALLRRADGIAGALDDGYLRTVLETGLIVTYARPFTEGRGSGFPIPAAKFVPAGKQELHQTMLKLRHQVQAHMDASAPEGFRRSVTRREETCVPSVMFRGPRHLKRR